MSTYEEMNKNLKVQINELEVLLSIYPKELIIADHGVLADINNFIKKPIQDFPQRLEYSIEISVKAEMIELLISLPPEYPREKPEVYSRSSTLNRTQQLLLNQELNKIVECQTKDEPCIYMLISWLQDNGQDYFIASNKTVDRILENRNNKKQQKESTTFARYWIYSHHIYNKLKRREVVSFAKENNLTGFCLAGKPGIICVEGAFEDCEYYWQNIKCMNWHKIVIRLLEKEKNCKDIASLRKFNDIQEIFFPTGECRNDMGQVLKYLVKHNSQHAFKELLGIEGKVTELLN